MGETDIFVPSLCEKCIAKRFFLCYKYIRSDWKKESNKPPERVKKGVSK